MRTIKKVKFISLTLFIFLVLGGLFILIAGLQPALAQRPLEVTYPDGEAPRTVETGLPEYVKYIFNFSIMIAGLVAFGALVAGGIRYLTSAGAPAVMADAKDQILAAFLGLIILLCSYLILVTINPQLTIFRVTGFEKYLIPEKEIPPPTEEEEKFVFFQVPTGKLIERSLFEDEAVGYFNEVILKSEDLENKTKELKNLSRDLKTLTDACECNQSSCSDINVDTGVGCVGLGCPSAFCDKEAIKTKIEEMKSVIDEIHAIQGEMSVPQSSVSYNFVEVRKAAALMSLLAEEIEDYNTMLTDRYFIEEGGTKVEFDYYLGWDDITVRMNGITVNDPASFYFNKQGNEETIELVQDLVGEAINPPPGYIPPPPPLPPGIPVGILSVPDFRQNDPEWAEISINDCNDKIGVYSPPCTVLSGCGCGPTSLTMILQYFGRREKPSDVARALRKNQEYWCGMGSSISGLARLAESRYGIPYHQSRFEDLPAQLANKRPVMVSCKNFGRGYPGYKNGWGHISVIKGIQGGYVYFQDPYVGEVAFKEDIVKNNFRCRAYYAFGP